MFVVLCVSGFRSRTVTPVPQVGPDDVFLGETEDAEPTSSHAGVDHNTGVRHHVHPLKQLHPETQRRDFRVQQQDQTDPPPHFVRQSLNCKGVVCEADLLNGKTTCV